MRMSKLLQKSEVYSEAKAVVESIGKPGCKGFTEDLVLKARMALASEFGSAFPELDVGKNRSSFQSNLWEAILADAKDPETEIVDWMRHGCPTGGKNSHITSCGIFPLATAASSTVNLPEPLRN